MRTSKKKMRHINWQNLIELDLQIQERSAGGVWREVDNRQAYIEKRMKMEGLV